jgi:hypothetical protein
MRAPIAPESLQVHRVVHLANLSCAVTRFVCAGPHTKLLASELKHLGHKEKPVHGAVRVKRRQNLLSTSNPNQFSLAKLTFDLALYSQLHNGPSKLYQGME